MMEEHLCRQTGAISTLEANRANDRSDIDEIKSKCEGHHTMAHDHGTRLTKIEGKLKNGSVGISRKRQFFINSGTAIVIVAIIEGLLTLAGYR